VQGSRIATEYAINNGTLHSMNILRLLSPALTIALLCLGNSALAQVDNFPPDDPGSSSSFGKFEVGLPGDGPFSKNQSIDDFITSTQNAPIKTLVNLFVTFATVMLVIIGTITIVIGGYMYMTAGGNASQVTSAKDMIRAALIGIFIAFISVALLNTINPYLGSDAVEPSLAPQQGNTGP